MQCHKCGSPLEQREYVPVHETCPTCAAYVHCCENCENYAPEVSGDCVLPDVEYIGSKNCRNFCDEFKPVQTDVAVEPPEDAKRRSTEARKRFDAMF